MESLTYELFESSTDGVMVRYSNGKETKLVTFTYSRKHSQDYYNTKLIKIESGYMMGREVDLGYATVRDDVSICAEILLDITAPIVTKRDASGKLTTYGGYDRYKVECIIPPNTLVHINNDKKLLSSLILFKRPIDNINMKLSSTILNDNIMSTINELLNVYEDYTVKRKLSCEIINGICIDECDNECDNENE